MRWNYHWRASPAIEQLERHIDELRTTIICLRRELQTKQTQVGGLKLALVQRLETIDGLNATIDQLRAANQKLALENDCLTALLVAPAPQLNGAKVAAFDRGEL